MGRMWTALLKRHWPLLPILTLALAVRLLPLRAVQANGGSPLIGDEGNYVEAAQALAGGAGIPDRWIWIRPPGYIAFLATVFRLTANSLVAAQVAQIAVALLTIVATYWLVGVGVRGQGSGVRGQGLRGGSSVASRRSSVVSDQVAVVEAIRNPQSAIRNTPTQHSTRNTQHLAALAALILALQPSLILATGLFLTETLFLLLVTGLLGTLLAYRRATGARAAGGWAAAAGGLAGLALLTRSSGLPLVGLAGIWLLRHPTLAWRRQVAALGLFAACLGALLLPWTLRNAAHYERFLPLDTAGAFALWTGNTDLPLAEIRRQFAAVPNLADRGSYALRAAATWAGAHPAEFVQRSLGRAVASLAPDNVGEIGYVLRDKLPGRPCAERDGFGVIAWWGWVGLFGLALAGWLSAPRDALWWLTGGVVAGYVGTIALTPPEFRYRYELFSLLAVYAARSLWSVVRGPWAVRGQGSVADPQLNTQHLTLNTRRYSAFRIPHSAFCVAVLAVWLVAVWPTFGPGAARMVDAAAAQRRGDAARAAGDAVGAAAAYTQAVARETTCAAVRRDLGGVLRAGGQPDAAAAAWGAALQAEPGDWQTRALLAGYWRDTAQPKRSAALTREVPPTFNGALLDWAWAGLGAAAPVTVTVGWDDAGWLRGFQIGEDAEDGPSFRWAGPGSESALRVQHPAPGSRLWLTMHSLPPPAPAPPTRPVTVAVAGRVLATLAVAPTWTTYPLALPADLPPGDLVVTFTSAPQQASVTDPRRLSFALQRAWIGP